MKKKSKLYLMGVIIFSMVITLNNCTAESSENESTLAKEIMDSIINPVSENLAEGVVFTGESEPAESTKEEIVKSNELFEITDFIQFDSKIYAVFNDGLIIYDNNTKEKSVIRTNEKMSAVIAFDNKIYVGGDYFYQLNNNSLEYLDDYDSPITVFYGYGRELMIGTRDGLFSKGIMGKEKLYDSISVSAMSADNNGLWVGTDGDGLYRWDGEKLRKRYLLRDSSLFDNVNSIDFKHNHLYVGSSNGLHIYDGGRWTTYTEVEGLLCDEVIDIDASNWVVYVATGKGVVSFFDGKFTAIDNLNQKRANAIIKRGHKIIVTTDHEGILAKTGKSVKTLVQPLENEEIDLLSMLF